MPRATTTRPISSTSRRTSSRRTTSRRASTSTARRPRRTTPILVKVAALNKEVKTVSVSPNATVREAVEAAFSESVKDDKFNSETGTEEIRVNNRPATLDTKLRDGAIVTLITDIKGAC